MLATDWVFLVLQPNCHDFLDRCIHYHLIHCRLSSTASPSAVGFQILADGPLCSLLLPPQGHEWHMHSDYASTFHPTGYGVPSTK